MKLLYVCRLSESCLQIPNISPRASQPAHRCAHDMHVPHMHACTCGWIHACLIARTRAHARTHTQTTLGCPELWITAQMWWKYSKHQSTSQSVSQSWLNLTHTRARTHGRACTCTRMHACTHTHSTTCLCTKITMVKFDRLCPWNNWRGSYVMLKWCQQTAHDLHPEHRYTHHLIRHSRWIHTNDAIPTSLHHPTRYYLCSIHRKLPASSYGWPPSATDSHVLAFTNSLQNFNVRKYSSTNLMRLIVWVDFIIPSPHYRLCEMPILWI